MDKDLLVLGGMAALFLLAVIVIFVWVSSFPPVPVCDRIKPTAGQILDCMATRTAEARHK